MDAVEAAFDACPRAGFLPASVRRRAAYDGPLRIAAGQTNSQPRTVDAMLRLLEVRPGQRVLDVGSGSGWTTALLAHLVGPTGEVVGVELEPELVDLRVGQPGGHPPAVGADPAGGPGRARGPGPRAVRPDPGLGRAPLAAGELVEQLGPSGRMVIPVAGWMTLVEMPGPMVTEHGAYRFVPLR